MILKILRKFLCKYKVYKLKIPLNGKLILESGDDE